MQQRLLDGKRILITGGTGSFGRKFLEVAYRDHCPRRLVVFSRDELKQHEMRALWPETDDSPVRFFIGDVRDVERLRRAFHDIDIVIHAAALKQVPACEYNPREAIYTNVIGAMNVVDAALDCGVKQVVALSTDKCSAPVNLYGATKLCAEKLFIQANAYRGEHGTRFSCVRYGNVVGSRGSVIPLWRDQRAGGCITVTDPGMTRFMITLKQAAQFVISSLSIMDGGEVFIPKLPSVNILDLARAMASECRIEYIGIRPGEKLHESLISSQESHNAVDLGDRYVLLPAHPWWTSNHAGSKPVPVGFEYHSDINETRLTIEQIKEMIANAG